MTQPVILSNYDPGWRRSYEAEEVRIREALGACTEGGVLYDLEHIGSTSVPGLAAKPCLDIMARVYPLPLPEDRVQRLIELGYEHLGEHGLPGRDYFRRGPHEVHLHVVSFDTELWARHLVFRDYLRANLEAAARYEAFKRELAAAHHDDGEAYTDGKGALVAVLEREAFAWHVRETGFGPVEAMARELAGLPRAWFVSSGWALDLFLGESTRYHDDLDIGIFRDDQLALQRHLLARDWRLHKVVGDGKYAPWLEGELLEASVTQVHAWRGDSFLDILLSPRQNGHWLYRRDEAISLPPDRAVMRSRTFPHPVTYLAPEIVLLFKSATSGKPPRTKDQEDFERALPALPKERRAWLRTSLAHLQPEHPWLEVMR